MNILALSGSLRVASINSALLCACARLAPAGVNISVFGGMGQLPLFNPDAEPHVPAPVTALYDGIARADALLIASPEYAHGVSGIVKNALDWLVSVEAFVGMPVAVLNASPRAHHADAALRETLKTMSAVIVESASLAIPLLGAGLDQDGIVGNAEVAQRVRQALAALQAAVVSPRLVGDAVYPMPSGPMRSVQGA